MGKPIVMPPVVRLAKFLIRREEYRQNLGDKAVATEEIDRIMLNDEMRTLWNVIVAAHGTHAINCADVVPEIRASGVGFGLVRL